jgi:hypothetical protein
MTHQWQLRRYYSALETVPGDKDDIAALGQHHEWCENIH